MIRVGLQNRRRLFRAILILQTIPTQITMQQRKHGRFCSKRLVYHVHFTGRHAIGCYNKQHHLIESSMMRSQKGKQSPEVARTALSMRSPNHFSVVTFHQVTPYPKFRRGCPLPQHGRTDGRKEVEKSIGTSPGSPVRETVKSVF